MKHLFLAAAALLLPATANAAVTLNVVQSFNKTSTGAFGLAFDGNNIWYSNNSGSIFEMTTSGVNTGNQITGTTWSALAWNSATNKIAIVENNGITQYNRAVGVQAGSALSPTHTNIAGSPNFLTDGLDIEGGVLWWSPDVNAVNKSNLDGSGVMTTFLAAGAGGYSGVEFLTASNGVSYVIVVNDGLNPRNLCIHNTDATLVGCTALANSRYEDLAFDGRYLYAADYGSSRIDKIDLLVDGGSIFGGVPEPTTWGMMLVGFGIVGGAMRRRQRTSVSFA